MNTALDTVLDNLAADGRASMERRELFTLAHDIRSWAQTEGVMVKFDWPRGINGNTARVYLRKRAA